MSFTPQGSIYCQKCGQPNATVYESKVSPRRPKTYIYILALLMIGIPAGLVVMVAPGAAPFVTIIELLILAIVLNFINRPRKAQVVVCNSCKGHYVLSDAPNATVGWDAKKLDRKVSKAGLHN